MSFFWFDAVVLKLLIFQCASANCFFTSRASSRENPLCIALGSLAPSRIRIAKSYGPLNVKREGMSGRWDLGRRWHLSTKLGGQGEYVGLNTVEERDGSNVGAVRHHRGSATAGEYVCNSTPAVEDHRARVSTLGDTRFGTARQCGNLLRIRTRLALEGVAKNRTDVVEASDSEP
jgi:hypothetical protein